MRESKSSTSRSALFWASQITTVSFEIVFFVMAGYWGDQRWGTTPWLLLVGSVFGLLVSAWHLWQMVRSLQRSEQQQRKSTAK